MGQGWIKPSDTDEGQNLHGGECVHVRVCERKGGGRLQESFI